MPRGKTTWAGSPIAKLDVLRPIAQGMSNAEIGQVLYSSKATVKMLVGRRLPNVGSRDHVRVVVFAHRTGFLPRL